MKKLILLVVLLVVLSGCASTCDTSQTSTQLINGKNHCVDKTCTCTEQGSREEQCISTCKEKCSTNDDNYLCEQKIYNGEVVKDLYYVCYHLCDSVSTTLSAEDSNCKIESEKEEGKVGCFKDVPPTTSNFEFTGDVCNIIETGINLKNVYKCYKCRPNYRVSIDNSGAVSCVAVSATPITLSKETPILSSDYTPTCLFPKVKCTTVNCPGECQEDGYTCMKDGQEVPLQQTSPITGPGGSGTIPQVPTNPTNPSNPRPNGCAGDSKTYPKCPEDFEQNYNRKTFIVTGKSIDTRDTGFCDSFGDFPSGLGLPASTPLLIFGSALRNDVCWLLVEAQDNSQGYKPDFYVKYDQVKEFFGITSSQTPAPKNLRLKSKDRTNITLEWDLLPEAAFYLIFRDNVNIINVTATTYQDLNLIENTEYTYYLKAFNNTYTTQVSEPSNTIKEKPLTPLCTITSVTVTPQCTNCAAGDKLKVEYTATGNCPNELYLEITAKNNVCVFPGR